MRAKSEVRDILAMALALLVVVIIVVLLLPRQQPPSIGDCERPRLTGGAGSGNELVCDANSKFYNGAEAAR